MATEITGTSTEETTNGENGETVSLSKTVENKYEVASMDNDGDGVNALDEYALSNGSPVTTTDNGSHHSEDGTYDHNHLARSTSNVSNSTPGDSAGFSTPERATMYPTMMHSPSQPSSLSSTPERLSIERSSLELQEDDTWTQITKRDRPLSNANAIAVMDHAHTVLAKRICEASSKLSFKENLNVFEKRLGRFQNSEIKLGRRLASGNFADIFEVTSFIPVEIELKPCTEKQKEAAEMIKLKFRPNELVVKVLRGNLLLNPSLYATAAADFITEGTLLASLDHPNIVSLLGRSVPTVEGFASGKRDSVFLVLERLHGDLTHRVRQWRERQSQNRIIIKGIAGRRDGRATILRERVEAMAELADALSYLHERCIIHRDLKLANVGVDARGRMKLLDFGLAKVIPSPQQDNETFLLTGYTGSVRYMAPEVARGERYNLKADVYSFGILFFEVLNLEKAFHGWQPREISERVHQKKHRPRVPLVWPGPLRDLLKATWSDIPAARLSMKHVHAILLSEAEDLRSKIDALEG